MDRGLVVVTNTELHRELLREAGSFAAGTDAELVLLVFLSEDDAEQNADAVEAIESAEGTRFDPDTPLDVGRSLAADFADDAVGDLQITYDTVAAITGNDAERASHILEIADQKGCDHAFLIGRQRSPTGKAIFGDTAQLVALDFAGPVTIVTEDI